MSMILPEEELGLRPLQAELFRLAPAQGATVTRRFDQRGTVSLVVHNPTQARAYLRWSERAPSASDYDEVVPPASIAIFAVERVKWVTAVVDYAGQPTAQDLNLMITGISSLVAYTPSKAAPAFGLNPSGLLVPLSVDVGGRLVTSSAGAGIQVDASATTAAAAALAPALGAVAGKTNYLTGLEITGGGATAAGAIDATVTGLAATLHYGIVAPAGAGLALAPIVVTFSPPRPASAVNTAITLNVPSFGAGNLIASAALHGFVL